MNGLLFLTDEDFQILNGQNGNILCTSIKGFSLVLLYSTQCSHCQSLIPLFKQLPGTISGCQFGMLNVSMNKKVILMSRNTISPINVVPYIILYVNGKPYMRYNGPHDMKEISRFVIEVAQSIQNKKKALQEDTQETDTRKGIPEYTIGQPLYGDKDVCYLEFSDAYINETSSMPYKKN